MRYSPTGKSINSDIHLPLQNILESMNSDNLNIMLIDDNEASHIIHKINIEDAGLDPNNVKSCYGVDEAINQLTCMIESGSKTNWPHYIFLDINMPRKSGYDFISEFEKVRSSFDTPTIYLVSSSINPEDVKRAEELKLVSGFKTKFLEKDFLKSLALN